MEGIEEYLTSDGDEESQSNILAKKENLAFFMSDENSLHYWVGLNDVAMTITSITTGVNINSIDSEQNIALHIAAALGHLEIAEYLIASGANINAKNNSNSTPLHYAILQNNYELAEMLIKHGSDLTIADNDGDTPIHFAAAEVNISLVELMLDKGADEDIKNHAGKTAYDIANQYQQTQYFQQAISGFNEKLNAALLLDELRTNYSKTGSSNPSTTPGSTSAQSQFSEKQLLI